MTLISLIYKVLISAFGPQNWWPIDKKYHRKYRSDPRFEVIVGAVLTQNTSWSNVEKALTNLKSHNILTIQKIASINIKKLKELIKPSGFFNQKALRIKNLSIYLYEYYDNNLNRFFKRDHHMVRKELLSLNGIGQETADSILLYAGNYPIFVVDAYTKRLCQRIPIIASNSYNHIQNYFQIRLRKIFPQKNLAHVYGEFHALIVTLGKSYCKKKPLCTNCPLKFYCTYKK